MGGVDNVEEGRLSIHGDICVLDALDSLGGAYKNDLFGSEDSIKIIGEGINDI